MALQIWCPLIKDTHNQGISNIMPSASGATFTTSGKIGSGALNSSNEFSVTIPELSGKKVWSFCFWGYVVSSTITSDWTQIARINDGSSNFRVEVCPKTTSNGIYCYSTHNNSGYAISNGSISSPNGGYYDQWAHFCLTSDGTTIFKYMNGELIGTCLYNGTGAITGTFVLTNNNKIYKNDLRVYDHCLSIRELKAVSSALVLHYPLNDAYVEGTSNLFTYPTPGSSCTNSYGWDKTLHKDAISVSGWYPGYNSGVGNPSTVYHAHWIMMDGLPTMRFPYITNSLGQTPKWLGISGWFRLQPSDFISGVKYTVSFDAKADENNSAVSCGLYYKRNSSENWNFYDGNRTTTLTTDWKRYSVTYTSHGVYEISSFYFYGVCSGPKGNRYIRNVQLEIKDHATPYTPNTRNETTVHDCSGYQNNGTINGSLSCSNDSPRYKTSTKFNTGNTQCVCPINSNIFTLNLWVNEQDCVVESNNRNQVTWSAMTLYRDHDSPAYTWYLNIDSKTRYSTAFYAATPGWRMVTLVSNGLTVTTYLNGNQYWTMAGVLSNCTGTITIGQNINKLINLSDVRLYATALSADDIKELYNTSCIINS